MISNVECCNQNMMSKENICKQTQDVQAVKGNCDNMRNLSQVVTDKLNTVEALSLSTHISPKQQHFEFSKDEIVRNSTIGIVSKQ